MSCLNRHATFRDIEFERPFSVSATQNKTSFLESDVGSPCDACRDPYTVGCIHGEIEASELGLRPKTGLSRTALAQVLASVFNSFESTVFIVHGSHSLAGLAMKDAGSMGGGHC